VNRPVRIGVIGCGGITAFAHIPAIIGEKRGLIAALCDTSLARIKVLRDRFQLQETLDTDNYNELIERSEVDAVIVASWAVN
jgi:predicted dehydrogenase